MRSVDIVWTEWECASVVPGLPSGIAVVVVGLFVVCTGTQARQATGITIYRSHRRCRCGVDTQKLLWKRFYCWLLTIFLIYGPTEHQTHCEPRLDCISIPSCRLSLSSSFSLFLSFFWFIDLRSNVSNVFVFRQLENSFSCLLFWLLKPKFMAVRSEHICFSIQQQRIDSQMTTFSSKKTVESRRMNSCGFLCRIYYRQDSMPHLNHEPWPINQFSVSMNKWIKYAHARVNGSFSRRHRWAILWFFQEMRCSSQSFDSWVIRVKFSLSHKSITVCVKISLRSC